MVTSRWSGSWTTKVEPESAHSLRVLRTFASRRLSGIVLMRIELLSGHDQPVADFAAHDDEDDFVSLDIVQRAELPHAEFELDEWGWAAGVLWHASRQSGPARASPRRQHVASAGPAPTATLDDG